MIAKPIYLDIEATFSSKIQEIGIVYEELEFKSSSIAETHTFINSIDTDYIVGHNIIAFDKKLLQKSSLGSLLQKKKFVDTLPISLLLFNEKTFHSLPKNYKSEDSFLNNPVEDAKLSRNLLLKAIEKFKTLPILQRNILYTLLKNEELYSSFFDLIEDEKIVEELSTPILKGSILSVFEKVVKNKDVLDEAMLQYKVELAFILAIRMPELEVNSQPPKVLYDYTQIASLQERLCFDYDSAVEELEDVLYDMFDFPSFASFPRQNPTLESGGTISQKEIIEASLRDESFLAVLPTGGGKTLTFWLPSLIKAKSLKTLTVIISPLQALIKDHMESFQASVPNYKAVALSGYLSPTERANAMEAVVNGDADILYIAPESLRSNALFNVLKNRVIERIVIDEAHCLSTWGNDFRHDYFYIGTFIRDLLKKKPFQENIPISCFTATAKPKVMDDITEYMESSLDVQMNRYIAVPERKNLDYEAYELNGDKAKYTSLLELITNKAGSTLIYIPSSTKKCDEIAEQLAKDTGKNVKSFHSKLETDVKMKILKEYINDTIDIVVATTAFGMGVDKPNIMNVIHYEISESLENYSQEAGRGARSQKLRADCALLFSQNDLDKHFSTLTRSKINADEINAIFRVLKKDKRNPVTLTSREIATKAGWDTEDNNSDYDMKVKTALLELEREEYILRGRNRVNYYADAISTNALAILQEELKKERYNEDDRIRLSRVLQTLLGNSKPEAVQLDELTEILGYSHELVTRSILELKELEIISDAKDLSVLINKNASKVYEEYMKIEDTLYNYLLNDKSNTIRMSELNQLLLDEESLSFDEENLSYIIKSILKSWVGSKHQFSFNRIDRQKDLWYFQFIDAIKVKEIINYKQDIMYKLLELLSEKLEGDAKQLVKFSMLELQNGFHSKVDAKIIDRALLRLHELRVLELGNGRFIYYAPMQITKLDKMLAPNKKYTKQEYKVRLQPYYEKKMESIHIVGEYSEKLLKSSAMAQEFMKDYFTLTYRVFLNKYGELKEKFKRPMTEYRYNKIFNSLSEEQQKVINDKESQAIMILAGPGSGKTKVLVHKIASLILQEDIKADQFLMLTYSRTAMMEFKSRLFELIGQLAYDIDIYTFHGFALQLVGREVKKESDVLHDIVSVAASQIKNETLEVPYKTVIVLDEYQDINADGFELIKALSKVHDNKKRLIGVGDDDQCILKDVNGADISFIKKFEDEFSKNEEDEYSYAQYELLTNFRSFNEIVKYSNSFVENLKDRYKKHPLIANSKVFGEVMVVKCSSENLSNAAVRHAKNLSNLDGLAILAHSNDEVSDIYSLLHESGISATYLLENEGFMLSSIVEVQCVDEALQNKEINEENLWIAYEVAKKRYLGSKNLTLLYKIIKAFIDEHEIYTQSLWMIYLEEITTEQFVVTNKNVLVSTIHKSKGKEFDKVILVAKNRLFDSDFIRLYYVGMTRAKKSLAIVTNNDNFVGKVGQKVEVIQDSFTYNKVDKKTIIMGLRDIYISYNVANKMDLIAGSSVKIYKDEIYGSYTVIQNGINIARFSKKLKEKIESYEKMGYEVIDSVIEYVVIIVEESSKTRRQLPLCKIIMKKQLKDTDE